MLTSDPLSTFSSNNDVLSAKFSTYIGFWLPEPLRRPAKWVYSMLIALSQFPRSLSALLSYDQFGKFLIYQSLNELLSLPAVSFRRPSPKIIIEDCN